MPQPFILEPPAAAEIPVVVEVPHAGLHVDPESLGFMLAPLRSVGRDADLYVDEIFADAPALGATLLRASFSRFVVDLNRSRDDVDGLTVDGGTAVNRPRGLVWRTTTEGDPILARRLPRPELDRRLALVYDPYHAALAGALEAKLAKFGRVVLLSGHSMPSTGRRGHVDVGAGRADVVPGSRGRTTAAAELIDAVEAVAVRHGYSVTHDDPYQGGFSTIFHGRPAAGRHAVQVELARRVYMDEETLARRPDGFARARAFARDLVEILGRIAASA